MPLPKAKSMAEELFKEIGKGRRIVDDMDNLEMDLSKRGVKTDTILKIK